MTVLGIVQADIGTGDGRGTEMAKFEPHRHNNTRKYILRENSGSFWREQNGRKCEESRRKKMLLA